MSEKGRVEPPPGTAPRPSIDNGISAAEAHHERRVLTALCYDLVGSTDLLALLDIEDFQDLIAAFQKAARQAVSSWSGDVRVEAGDGGVALFPADIDARDAASLAIRAGLEIIDACHRVGAEKGRVDLHVRVGIATSMTLIEKGDTKAGRDTVTGPAFAMATRLQAIAQPDTVVVSEETRNLAGRSHVFSFRGTHTIKGFPEPERVWHALSHKREVDRFFAFGRLSSPLVDREAELGTIAELWDNAVAGNGSVVLVEGEAGIGKSRILHEVRRRTRFQRTKLLLFQCLPGDTLSALHPLLQNVRGDLTSNEEQLSAAAVADVFGDHDVHDADVVEIFSFLLGAAGANPTLKEIDPEAIREKANWAVRRSLEALCASGPVVLVVEDIQWIDLTSRQLLAELAQHVHRCPALLIVTTRPGYADWLQAPNRRSIALRPLNREETRQAITAMWPQGRPSTSPELLDVVERVTGGVPLFIEEICQWMAENAASATDRLAQTATRSHASVFESVLEARLETLGPAREVARAAAVAGNRFNHELVRVLLPEFDDETIASALDSLSEAGFLIRVRPSGAPVYGVRHALIQETIYNATLRKRRQALHRRLFTAVSRNRNLAGWLGTAALAEHAERAGLLEDAIDQFVIAGTESSSRSAMVEARQILEHALTLCGQVADRGRQDALRLSALAALGPVLTATEGPRSSLARKNYEDGVEIATRRPLAERAKWFPIYWGWWYTGSDFRIMHDRALRVQEMLSGIDDPEIMLQIEHCIWAIDFNLGRHRETLDAIEAGLALYDDESARMHRALFGGHDAKVCGLGQKALSLWLTGSPEASDAALAEMIGFVDSIGHIASKAHSLDTEAVSAFYREDFDRLAVVSERMRDFAARNKMEFLAGLSLLFGGWARARQGDLAGGHALFERGLTTLKQLGSVVDLPIYLDMQAMILGLEGELDTALEVATEAVAEAEGTGHAYWLAELYRRRADLLAQAGGDRNLIVADLRFAMTLAKQQGAAALLERARRSAESLGLAVEV
jgi:predicted ATPase/class 3 adenylate cyclase